jgi:hypothetical protein
MLLTVFILLGTPIATAAQTFFPQSVSIQTLQPLPAIPCAGPFAAFCAPANQYISTYNSYVNAINRVNEIGLEVRTYARYPQVITSHFKANMQSVADLLQQAQTLSFTTQNIERQVSSIWPNYTPGTPLAQLNGTLEDQTASAIVAELKGAGLLDSSSTADSVTTTIDDMRSAAAKAQNPTQTGQVTVQLLSLVWEELVKEKRLLALRMSEEAQHDLTQTAQERQQRLYDQAIVTNLQHEADTTPPTLSDTQVRTMLGPSQ